jgi:C4-dicarboxylate-specific signal transduction histidine kinase
VQGLRNDHIGSLEWTLFDWIPHHVWTRRIDGVIDYANRRLRDYWGDGQREAWSEVHPEDAEKVQRAWHVAWSNAAPYEIEHRIRARDGTYRHFLSRASPVHDECGQVVKYFGTDTDVDALTQADDGLRSALADLARVSRVTMLGEISASLAHELNQPLAAIVANCDASSRWQRASPPNLQEMALASERIRRDALRASAVLACVRAFLRKAEPGLGPVHLGEALREVVELLSCELQRHHVDTRLLVPADLPPIIGTRVELQQVFVNLITNAVESLAHLDARRARRLVVECSRRRVNEQIALLVTVHDSGDGFPEDHQQRLFDAFFTTKSDGLGMGLAISRSIVRRHGGELRARNTPDGPRFEFHLPLPPAINDGLQPQGRE